MGGDYQQEWWVFNSSPAINDTLQSKDKQSQKSSAVVRKSSLAQQKQHPERQVKYKKDFFLVELRHKEVEKQNENKWNIRKQKQKMELKR